jgi:hypothetical protein
VRSLQNRTGFWQEAPSNGNDLDFFAGVWEYRVSHMKFTESGGVRSLVLSVFFFAVAGTMVALLLRAPEPLPTQPAPEPAPKVAATPALDEPVATAPVRRSTPPAPQRNVAQTVPAPQSAAQDLGIEPIPPPPDALPVDFPPVAQPAAQPQTAYQKWAAEADARGQSSHPTANAAAALPPAPTTPAGARAGGTGPAPSVDAYRKSDRARQAIVDEMKVRRNALIRQSQSTPPAEPSK